MRKILIIGSALLSLAAFASTADARMGGMSMPSSMSHGDTRAPPPSLGSSHGFSADAHGVNAAERAFSADRLETRVKGSNWKKPIDSDQGGADDPQKKPPKGSTQTDNGGVTNGNSYDPYGYHNHHPGYVDAYGHYHPPTGDSLPPALACRGRVNGC